VVLEIIGHQFTVCKISDVSQIDFSDRFCFVGKTDGELSLVCETSSAPPDAPAREDGWQAFRVKGALDFSLTGILAALLAPLAKAGIGIFAVSTFDTDYILVKKENLEKALSVLSAEGHEVIR